MIAPQAVALAIKAIQDTLKEAQKLKGDKQVVILPEGSHVWYLQSELEARRRFEDRLEKAREAKYLSTKYRSIHDLPIIHLGNDPILPPPPPRKPNWDRIAWYVAIAIVIALAATL